MTPAAALDGVTTRFNIYNNVHKGLRALLVDTLVAVGRMDDTDERDVVATLASVRAMLKLCLAHLQKENHFIHPALEARQPGSTARVAREHLEHEQAFHELEQQACRVEGSSGAERTHAAARLYADLALFVADNLRHMHVEETGNNAALHKTHSDAELAALNGVIVASIPPGQQRAFLRWIVPSLTPAERARMFTEMKAGAPPAVFSDTLAQAREHLDARDWNKLRDALESRPAV
jgi:hypothetical protein